MISYRWFYIAVAAPARRRCCSASWSSVLDEFPVGLRLDVHSHQGLVNRALRVGLTSRPLELLYNDFSVLLGLVYGEPFMILRSCLAREAVLSLLEASADLDAPRATSGASAILMTMPGSSPASSSCSFRASTTIVSDLLGGGRRSPKPHQNQFAVARNKPLDRRSPSS